MSAVVVGSIDPHFPLGGVRGVFPPEGDGEVYILTSPFRFVDGDTVIDVPTDFLTDFNSVPRALWVWFHPLESLEAGVVHDYGYKFNPGNKTRAYWDDLHRRILHIKGMRKSKRLAAWLGIRAGGWRAWARYRKEGADRG